MRWTACRAAAGQTAAAQPRQRFPLDQRDTSSGSTSGRAPASRGLRLTSDWNPCWGLGGPDVIIRFSGGIIFAECFWAKQKRSSSLEHCQLTFVCLDVSIPLPVLVEKIFCEAKTTGTIFDLSALIDENVPRSTRNPGAEPVFRFFPVEKNFCEAKTMETNFGEAKTRESGWYHTVQLLGSAISGRARTGNVGGQGGKIVHVKGLWNRAMTKARGWNSIIRTERRPAVNS